MFFKHPASKHARPTNNWLWSVVSVGLVGRDLIFSSVRAAGGTSDGLLSGSRGSESYFLHVPGRLADRYMGEARHDTCAV